MSQWEWVDDSDLWDGQVTWRLKVAGVDCMVVQEQDDWVLEDGSAWTLYMCLEASREGVSGLEPLEDYPSLDEAKAAAEQQIPQFLELHALGEDI